MATQKARQWRGINVQLRERRQARQALLETWQWAQSDHPLSRIAGQVRTLSEYDEQYLDLLVQDLLWDYLGAQSPSLDRERKSAVDGSRQAWRSASPLAQWAIWTWTAWGLGDGVQLSAEDERNGQDVLDEFLEADRNAAVLGQDRLHAISERVLIDGNAFLAFFASTVDGQSTVRLIKQDEIEIVANPDDDLTPWFYRRTFTAGDSAKELYYPDWGLYFGGEDAPVSVDEAWARLQDQNVIPRTAQRADQVQNGNTFGEAQAPGTAVCILHIAHNRKDLDSLWGWPLLTVALPWLRTHKRFAQARLTVALSVAQFVRRSKVSGGSRAVQSVIDTIASNLDRNNYTDTNPPAAPGSWHVENKAVDTTELPMRTGASDAEADNKMFAWLAALGAGLFPTSTGLDTSRYATAVEMDKVQSFLFSRYKRFWSAQFKRIARIVLSFVERFGGKTYQTKDVEVSIDSYSLPDFPPMVDSSSKLMTSLHEAVALGVAPAKTVAAIDAALLRPALQALGSEDSTDLTSDEAWSVSETTEAQSPAQEALRRVAANFAEGEIELETLAECVIAEAVEQELAFLTTDKGRGRVQPSDDRRGKA